MQIKRVHFGSTTILQFYQRSRILPKLVEFYQPKRGKNGEQFAKCSTFGRILPKIPLLRTPLSIGEAAHRAFSLDALTAGYELAAPIYRYTYSIHRHLRKRQHAYRYPTIIPHRGQDRRDESCYLSTDESL
jgi:hypothetical protein